MNYLVLRKQTYHYRRRVPGDVQALIGQKFWKQSLKTSSFRDAEIRARALGVQHDRIIKGLRELPEIERLRLRRNMLEKRQVEAVLKIRSCTDRDLATRRIEAVACVDVRANGDGIDAERSRGSGRLITYRDRSVILCI
ncbi:MAG: DUF6538 domain-containing protein [Hyphomicrobium sp.]